MPNTNSFIDNIFGTSFVTTFLDLRLRPMPSTYSSFDSIVGASFVAANLANPRLRPMPKTDSSPLGISGASLMAANLVTVRLLVFLFQRGGILASLVRNRTLGLRLPRYGSSGLCGATLLINQGANFIFAVGLICCVSRGGPNLCAVARWIIRVSNFVNIYMVIVVANFLFTRGNNALHRKMDC